MIAYVKNGPLQPGRHVFTDVTFDGVTVPRVAVTVSGDDAPSQMVHSHHIDRRGLLEMLLPRIPGGATAVIDSFHSGR